MKIFCSIVGMPGRLLEVEIGNAASVCALKKSVIKMSMDGIKARDLQLFLAKKNSGAWLDVATAAAVVLDGDGRPLIIDEDGRRQGFGGEMNPTLRLKNDKYFGENFEPDDDQVHVLVVAANHARIDVGNLGPRALAYKQRRRCLLNFQCITAVIGFGITITAWACGEVGWLFAGSVAVGLLGILQICKSKVDVQIEDARDENLYQAQQ